MMCERCRAGQMLEYEKNVGRDRVAVIRGLRCERCGFVQLSDDDSVWAAV